MRVRISRFPNRLTLNFFSENFRSKKILKKNWEDELRTLTWTSIGKELNLIGQMNVILLASACIRLCSSSTQRPSSLERMVWVSKDWRLRISTSGIQRSLRMARLRAVRRGSGSSSKNNLEVDGSEVCGETCWQRSVPAVSNNHPTVPPLHYEVSIESHGEIFVRHFRNILDVHTYGDISWCLWRKLELDVVIG